MNRNSLNRNLAARAGHWSAQHRKRAILGWLAFVIVTIAIGGAVGTRQIQDNQGVGESARATSTFDSAFPKRATEQVLLEGPNTRLRHAVGDVISRLRAVPGVSDVRQTAGTHGAALVQFHIDGKPEQTKKRVGAPLAATAAAAKANPGVRIEEAGDASAAKALDKSFSDDFSHAQRLSIPITLLILLFAFGALAAAGIPVLLALSGVGATLGIVALVSHISAVDPAISEVVLLIGMAVGVDYSLFYLRREREERAAGRDPDAALQAAAATSGRSVLVSGLTVMAAMAGMFLTGSSTFASFAVGTIIVVAVAVLASLTVLPALLSALGDRVMKGRIPYVGRHRDATPDSRVWGAIVDRVLRRPAVSATVAGGLLVALSIPAFGLHTAAPGLQGLPDRLPIVHTLNRIDAAFPGGPQPAQVVVQARDVTSPQVTAAIRSLEQRAIASGQAHPPFVVNVSADRSVALVQIPLSGRGTDARSTRALETLRGDLIPPTVGRVAQVSVGGNTAGSKDFNDLMKSHAPYVFAFVLGVAFLLLLVTFRSIVIPLKAIVLNLLSVAASYGVLVLVFQHRWAESLLGFKSTGAITSWLPLFLFVILFGLSMDYHVFILSRVREAFDRGMRTSDAVAHGVKSTAGVVTSAAVVMVAVFAIFASLGALEFKQMGVGLAAAILIDATVVRAVLLPATMKLLGDWNWYLPRRLAWLPRISHEPQLQPEGARP
jgi:uncharacterized membrane protein YdfJ with MMPL/SSD domain